MATLVTVIHVFVCLFLVLTVLLQPGKGGGMGGAFGGGSTQSVFGGSGGSGLLRKATVFIAALFMLSSMTLAWLASNTGADALKDFSASERQKHERKQQLRDEVLRGAEGVSGDEDLVIDEEMLGEDAPSMPPGQDPAQEIEPEELDRILEEAMREQEGDLEEPDDGANAPREPAPAGARGASGAEEPAVPAEPAPVREPTPAPPADTGDDEAAAEDEAAADDEASAP